MALNKETMQQQAKCDEERRTAAMSGGGGGKFVTIPYSPPNTLICILPARPEANGLPFQEIVLHFGFIGGDGRNRVYVCAGAKYGKCPICQRVEWMKANNQAKQAVGIAAQKYYLYNIVDAEGNQRVLRAKASQHREFRAVMLREDGDITDLNKGAVLEIERLKVDPWCRAWVKGKGSLPTSIQTSLKLDDLTKMYVENTPEELDRMMNGEDVNANRFTRDVPQQVKPMTSPLLQSVSSLPTPASTTQPEIKAQQVAQSTSPDNKNPELQKLRAMLQED